MNYKITKLDRRMTGWQYFEYKCKFTVTSREDSVLSLPQRITDMFRDWHSACEYLTRKYGVALPIGGVWGFDKDTDTCLAWAVQHADGRAQPYAIYLRDLAVKQYFEQWITIRALTK